MIRRKERRKILLQTEAARKRDTDQVRLTMRMRYRRQHQMKASRIILSMVATKVIEKERSLHSKCCLEKHDDMERKTLDKQVLGRGQEHPDGSAGYMRPDYHFRLGEPWVRAPVRECGINFPSSGNDAESNGTGCVRMAHSDTKIMLTNQTDAVRWRDDGKMQLVTRGMRWSLQGSEWKSNSKHVERHGEVVETEAGIKRKTPTRVTKATGRGRDIDETLIQHDVQASREAAGTSSPAVKSSIQKETWLNSRQADSKTLHACQNTLQAAEDLTKETVLSTG